MKLDQNLIIATGFAVFNYAMVFFAIIADLISGVQKAIKMGIARSSYGFRRTVDKAARYFVVMMGLTVLDALQISVCYYFVAYQKATFPIFPFATLIGAIFLTFIEVKSIYEKAEDKVRLESVANMAGKIYTHKDDLPEIIKAVMGYMNDPETKPISVSVESDHNDAEIKINP